jgi:hypothetical protein
MAADGTRPSFWGGLGSLLNSVVEKTLGVVDGLQDQITALDEKIQTRMAAPGPKKNFDESLLSILENPSTYLDPPTAASFQPFADAFDLDSHVDDISLFCDHSPTLRRIHSRLVPSALTEQNFWCRLFFRLGQRDEAKQMSQKLLEHVATEEPQRADGQIELTAEELEALAELENADVVLEGWEDD